jgi:DNA-binding Lrp family transcriptional regulator
VTPQRGEGFDIVAERIYKFPEVESCYLMSGGFDLTVIIRGKTMKEVALFVAEKLSTLDSVLSTSTHFVLKKYKENGEVFEVPEKDQREAVIL